MCCWFHQYALECLCAAIPCMMVLQKLLCCVMWRGVIPVSSQDFRPCSVHSDWFCAPTRRCKETFSISPIFSRNISICISAKPCQTTFIWVYALTSDHNDEVEKFYEYIESTIAEVHLERHHHFTRGLEYQSRTKCI